MIAPRFILLLVFASPQAFGSEVDFYTRISECVKLSIFNNNLHGYSPYAVSSNFAPKGVGFTVNYKDIKLYGFPNYTLNAFQLSKEGKRIVRISYRAFWKRLEITAHAEGALGTKTYHGPALSKITNVTCHGTVYYEKPRAGHINGRVIDLDSFCESDNITINFTTLSTQPFNDVVTTSFYNTYILENKRVVEDFLIHRLNTEWLEKPDKINNLFKSCKFEV